MAEEIGFAALLLGIAETFVEEATLEVIGEAAVEELEGVAWSRMPIAGSIENATLDDTVNSVINAAMSRDAWALGIVKAAAADAIYQVYSGFKRSRGDTSLPENKSDISNVSLASDSFLDIGSSMMIDLSRLSQLNQMQNLPVAWKGKSCKLPAISKWAKPTPKIIQELFPLYYQKFTFNNLNGKASLAAEQSFTELGFLQRSELLDMFAKSLWPADQNVANVAGTDYATKATNLLTTLGYPYGFGSTATTALRPYDIGMYYTYKTTHTFFNPVEVPAYCDVYVYGYGGYNSATPTIHNPGNSLPWAYYTDATIGAATSAQDRFYVSTTQGPGATETTTSEGGGAGAGQGAITQTANLRGDVTGGAYEKRWTDLKAVGAKPKGVIFSKTYPQRHHIRVILPPAGTLTFSISRPESYMDLAEVSEQTTVNRHTYFVTIVNYGPYMFSDSAVAGSDDNWGRGPSKISVRTTSSYSARFHTTKESLGMQLQTADIRITAGNAVSIQDTSFAPAAAQGEAGGAS